MMKYFDLNSIEDNLFCPICYEVYKKPKLLRCLHSFCEKCVKKWLVLKLFISNKNKYVLYVDN